MVNKNSFNWKILWRRVFASILTLIIIIVIWIFFSILSEIFVFKYVKELAYFSQFLFLVINFYYYFKNWQSISDNIFNIIIVDEADKAIISKKRLLIRMIYVMSYIYLIPFIGLIIIFYLYSTSTSLFAGYIYIIGANIIFYIIIFISVIIFLSIIFNKKWQCRYDKKSKTIFINKKRLIK